MDVNGSGFLLNTMHSPSLSDIKRPKKPQKVVKTEDIGGISYELDSVNERISPNFS